MTTEKHAIDKWSSLLGGRSPLSDTVSNVATGSVNSTKRLLSTTGRSLSNGVKEIRHGTLGAEAWVVLAIVLIFVVWAFRSDKGVSTMSSVPAGPSGPVVPLLSPPVTVVQATANEASDEPVDAEVVPKYKSMTYFDTNEDVGEPFVQSYSDFQRAFQSGRSYAETDKPTTALMSQQLMPMREALRRKGVSLESYVDSNDVSVPDSLLDAWNAVPTPVNTRATVSEDAETAMLAREALPVVSTKAADVEALRDILAARTEATRIGFALPEVPSDQKAALEFWASSKHSQASALAKTILSRA